MGEFDLIGRYFNRRPAGSGHGTSAREGVLLGIGDDAAMLTPNGRESLVVTTDMLVAGRHFPEDTDPESIGYRSLAVNLSDLAAMGARPTAFTLALALPPNCAQPEWLNAFSTGLHAMADRHGIALIGGDTVSAERLTLSITAMGHVLPEQALRRSGAKTGDLVAVTGTLGDAGLGLITALDPDAVPQRVTPEQQAWLRQRLDRPTPRVEVGQALTAFAHAAIDISDGLVQDLGHVLAASEVGADIDIAAIPLSSAARCWLDAQPERRLLPLQAGDDYELLFTLPPEAESRLADLPVPVTVIGRVTAETGLRLRGDDGRPVEVASGGYDHFRGVST